MYVSALLVRWYKSFNTRHSAYLDDTYQPRPWERRGDEFFPVVEVPLDPLVSTIVGANESGKSHVLSAIQKSLLGSSTAGTDQERYDIAQICRYCSLGELEDDAPWPLVGVRIRFETDDEYNSFRTTIGATASSSPIVDVNRTISVVVDGSQSEECTFYDQHDQVLKSARLNDWPELSAQALPGVCYIDSKMRLSNEVHVDQLLALYNNSRIPNAYLPIVLQDVGEMVSKLDFEEGAPLSTAAASTLRIAQDRLTSGIYGPRDGAFLESLLFRDILGVRLPILERLRDLADSNRGYVERVVSEINARIADRLDIARFWHQDEDFALRVEFKGGVFYFLLTDRSGATYTFEERSSGLQYFLSYYIQLKAAEACTEDRGTLVLMDEPDRFLSAVAQRNLLQVFDAIASNHGPRIQIVYTTHSPFSIHKNFPRRVSLVRKGDGSEGTQLVTGSATRRFEPVRTGLGIDTGETLFVGTSNVVLEGSSDVKVLVAAVQRFGDPNDAGSLLNLNQVTLLSADGVSRVQKLVARSIDAAERAPVVVVLVDGDGPGLQESQLLVASSALSERFVKTIADCSIDVDWIEEPKELEDLVPPRMLAIAIRRLVMRRWKVDCGVVDVENTLATESPSDTMAKRVPLAVRHFAHESKAIDGVELKALVFDELVDALATGTDLEGEACVEQFRRVVEQVCKVLREMIGDATDDARRARIHKLVRVHVDGFEKAHRKVVTRGEVERVLQRIEDVCVGNTGFATKSRESIRVLRVRLSEQAEGAGDVLDAESWLQALRKLRDKPWRSDW